MQKLFLTVAACALTVLASRVDAAMVSYGFDGTVTEVSKFGAPAEPGGKITGTISFDNEAPGTSGGDLITDYGEPGIKMTGTFFVLGTPFAYNDPFPINDDTMRLVSNEFGENLDAFHFFRVGGEDTALTISLSGLPSVTGNTGILSQFDVNYPALPPNSTGSFELHLPTSGEPLVIIWGTINSFVPIPEPAAFALASIGAAALAVFGVRRRFTN